MTPLLSRASTTTKRPATSGSTLHDTSLTIGKGLLRAQIVAAALVRTPADGGRQAKRQAERRRGEERSGSCDNPDGGDAAAAGQRRRFDVFGDGLTERPALGPAQEEVAGDDRDSRGRQIEPQPNDERRHGGAVHHEVGRVRDRQDERGRIGDSAQTKR